MTSGPRSAGRGLERVLPSGPRRTSRQRTSRSTEHSPTPHDSRQPTRAASGRSAAPVLGSGFRSRRTSASPAGLDRRPEHRPDPAPAPRLHPSDRSTTERRGPHGGSRNQFAEAVIDNGRFGTRTVRFETGRLAKQAAGSAVVYLDGETMLLSATTAGKHPKDQFDFFPLTVDVEERMYAAGRIPGSFFRREGRPSTDAILTCRLIDRPLRPPFVKGLRNEVQVVITVLALNPDDLYDVVAINARLDVDPARRPAVHRPDRRRPRRPHRGPVGRLPDGTASSSAPSSTWSSPAGRHRPTAMTSRS